MEQAARLLSLTVSTYLLFGLLQGQAGAYYVSVQASTAAKAGGAVPPDAKSVNTGQVAQSSVSASIGSSSSCTAGQTCPEEASSTAQASFTGTAVPGSLSALASGAANMSGPRAFGPGHYGSGGTLAWQDTVTITQEGDFKVTLRLDSSVN